MAETRIARQTLFLSGAQIIGLFTSFLYNFFLAKHLGPINFGIYTLSLAVLTFLAIFFDFGYFASLSRILAVAPEDDETAQRESVGAGIVIFLLLAAGYSIVLYVLARWVIPAMFPQLLSMILKNSAFVGWSFIAPFFVELVAKGRNRIESYSFFLLAWRLGFGGAIAGLYYMGVLTPLYLVLANSCAGLVAMIFVLWQWNPLFSRLRMRLRQLHDTMLVYGVHMYGGRIIAVSCYEIDRIMLGHLFLPREVGYYSLSISMAKPIGIFSASLASAKFKSFSKQPSISQRLLAVNALGILAAVLATNVAAWVVVGGYLGPSYGEVLFLLALMSGAAGFQAAYQPYNAWLASNGFGKWMLSINVKMALVTLFFTFLMVPAYGARGAAAASLCSMGCNFFFHWRAYLYAREAAPFSS